MATGTGKTRTALGITNWLLDANLIDTVIITVNGTDLLTNGTVNLPSSCPMSQPIGIMNITLNWERFPRTA